MIFHVSELHSSAEPRVHRARASWQRIYGSRVMPVHLSRFPRSARQIGDSRDLPMLKDVLEAGLKKCGESDVVMFTNSDIFLMMGVEMAVSTAVQRQGAVCSFRLNVEKVPERFEGPRMPVEQGSKPDYGRDLFAFSRTWLEAHWELVPDCFLGEMEWDLVMALLIRRSLGIEMKSTADFHRHTSAELPLGFVLHEKHQPVWKTQAGLESPSKWWNRAMCRRSYETIGRMDLYTLGD